MIRAPLLLPVFATLLLAAATAAEAQPRAQAGASLTVIRSLTVRVEARLRFGRLNATLAPEPVQVAVEPAPQAGEADPGLPRRDRTGRSPAIAVITGDPGRAYRVLLPREVRTPNGDHPVTRLTVWSANLGDVTRTRTGQLDARGRDVLRIGGVLTAPEGVEGGVYSAHVPVQIAYE